MFVDAESSAAVEPGAVEDQHPTTLVKDGPVGGCPRHAEAWATQDTLRWKQKTAFKAPPQRPPAQLRLRRAAAAVGVLAPHVAAGVVKTRLSGDGTDVVVYLLLNAPYHAAGDQHRSLRRAVLGSLSKAMRPPS